jgi:signal transduction histidine kinase
MHDTVVGPEVDFFWMVVYELRQPLTAITGNVQLARRFIDTDPRRVTEALDEVVTMITRLDRLLVDLHERARSAAAATGLPGDR